MTNEHSQPRHEDRQINQERADVAERQALVRYLALRALWSPCWGGGQERGLRQRGH